MGHPVRLWRLTNGALQLAAGPSREAHQPTVTPDGELLPTDTATVLAAVPGSAGYYYECPRPPDGSRADPAGLGSLLAQLLEYERDTMEIAEELSNRYEEIDLLYTITDTLGRTIGLEEAASVIVREVSTVVGARRASILVFDGKLGALRPVAGWGIDVSRFEPIDVDDAGSVAARAFREQRIITGSSGQGRAFDAVSQGRPYRGAAFMSVPIVYPDPDGRPRAVGVVNLTDRLGRDRFGSGHQKLVAAIAHQIGAAIENAHLVAQDRERQRVRHELALAHDLQLRLLPPPLLPGSDADVAARCHPAEGVGGDFFRVLSLPQSRIGVMLGDVSTHGFRAALIMALVLSAAGIHAAAAGSPAEALNRLLASVRAELAKTEMHLSLFYGVLDPRAGILRYANAGHPHAFRVRRDGEAARLGATAPPLGLSEEETTAGAESPWVAGRDLLLLVSDGITEAENESGERFGEARVLDIVRTQRDRPAQAIVDAVCEAVAVFDETATDDRTILVLKA